jgi:hypothetical protein
MKLTFIASAATKLNSILLINNYFTYYIIFFYYALAYRNYTHINVYFLTICVWNSSKKLKSYMNPDLYILFVIKPCLLLSNCLFSYSRKQNLAYITFLITPFVRELNCSFINLEKISIVFLFFFTNSLKKHYKRICYLIYV